MIPLKGVFFILSKNEINAGYELKFWLQIMGDHARFVKGSLNPDQKNLILIAGNLRKCLIVCWKKSGKDIRYRRALLMRFLS